jgi:8-oxo-dGTP pyrophosphatase MutT (NUDIX family)
VGRLRPEKATALLDWPGVFKSRDTGVALHEDLVGYRERSEAVAGVLEQWVRQGLHEYLLGEPYPVTPGGREEALLEIDRSAASLFGLRTFGQHLNGFVEEDGEIAMWVGRRAADRRLFPGKLDQMVAGGVPAGISLRENLVKECREEAGIDPEMAAQALPVGAVSYNLDNKKGYKYDILYCYDLSLPADFAPVCTDGEVEEFLLLPLGEVVEILLGSEDFKPNCNLVIIDFLLRRGVIGPEHPEYLALTTGLHPEMSVPHPGRGN